MIAWLYTLSLSWKRKGILVDVITTRRKVVEHREAVYETNRRFEAMTDIAERIGYAIDTTISYELRGDHVYALTDTKDRPFYQQTAEALRQGHQFNDDQAFERTRLSHEHDEAMMVDQLARGELGGNIMIKLSKVPDAVVRGDTSISGYRRDLLRSFVRIYYAEEGRVDCRLFSLDGNNRSGMEAVGQLLGISVTDRSSEAILADQHVVNVPAHEAGVFIDGLTSATKRVYDQAIYTETGRRTHSGSLLVSDRDALSLVASQHHIIDEHLRSLDAIAAMGRSRNAELVELERRRAAAAIVLLLRGVAVLSSSDGVVSSEVQIGNYERDCATATNGMNQSQYLNQEWKFGSCRVCLRDMLVGGCSVCAACAAADNRGESLQRRHERAVALRRKIAENVLSLDQRVSLSGNKLLTKQQMAELKYGKKARVDFRLQIGGGKLVAIDKITRQELGDI